MIIRKEHTNITCTNDILRPLLKMGWDSHFQTHLDNICNEKVFPARVVGVQKNSFFISQGNSESLATAAGKLNHQKEKFPVKS
jgi:ribosome biogenesis GTPase